MFGSADAQSSKVNPADVPPIKPGTNTSFASLKQIDAGLLNVGYAEAGPANGPAVILLHGWPYDIHSYADVAPLLAAAGYRVIVPYLRGYGTTRFLSSDTFRNGQQSVVALDIIALMDALKIKQAIIVGFDLVPNQVAYLPVPLQRNSNSLQRNSNITATEFQQFQQPAIGSRGISV